MAPNPSSNHATTSDLAALTFTAVCVLLVWFQTEPLPCPAPRPCPEMPEIAPCDPCVKEPQPRAVTTVTPAMYGPGTLSFWVQPVEAGVDAGWIREYRRFFEERGNVDMSAHFRNMTVVDLGSGVRPLLFGMQGASVTAVEPLDPVFLSKPVGPSVKPYARTLNTPVEQFVPALEGVADVVISLFTLDRVDDAVAYLSNAQRYLKPQNAYVYVLVDVHSDAKSELASRSLIPVLTQHVYAAGLRFERGGCANVPFRVREGFASCWMVLVRNRDY